MLKKVIGLKNVGRFRDSRSRVVPELLKYVFILGANGFGKTTLCAVLRSVQTGESKFVTGRHTLAARDLPEVDLLTDKRPVHFDGITWDSTIPEIAIFDSVFVAENVHSGDAVEVDHRRNLYRVIIGEAGVALAHEDRQLVADIRAKTSEISTIKNIIESNNPSDINLKAFLELVSDPDIDSKIMHQTQTVAAFRQAQEIRAHSLFGELKLPVLPDQLEALLASTIETIAEDATKRVAEHLAQHQMADETWVATGVEHIADSRCPFCGQTVDGLALVAAYRSLFSDSYRALQMELREVRATLTREFGDGAIGRLNTQQAENRADLEFWRRYETLNAGDLELSADLADAMVDLRETALVLLDHKIRAPLESVHPDVAFTQARDAFNRVCGEVAVVNTAIRQANSVITNRKDVTAGGEVKAAEADLNRLRAVQKRHEPAIAQMCADYKRLQDEKDELERRKQRIRTKLDEHTNNVIKPYELRINKLLANFNAGFTIAEMKHSYAGGVASSSYQLVINDVRVEVGDSKTDWHEASFKNTLSAGDRATLSLALFLVQIEQDPYLNDKIVVFDDPFSSQDAFRRQQTIHEILEVGKGCAQVIVLSHDACFLRRIWDKCPADQRMALQISDMRALGSKIGPCDIEEASKGRIQGELDDLHAFLDTGAGEPRDVARKLRIVLETHCRVNYPGFFGSSDTLGSIVGTIRTTGTQHPAYDLLGELDQINQYSREEHHGQDPTVAGSSQLDETELKGFVARTLKLVNAIQA